MTTSWQWSYHPIPDVRTPKEVVANLIQIRARGGNMLLNVGPRPAGRIADPDEALLRDCCNLGYARGRWPRFPDEPGPDATRFSVTSFSANNEATSCVSRSSQ